MKNSTVNSGNSRSKINSVGVGQPNNRRKSAIVKSMVSPASMPATNPQKIDLTSGRGGETVELPISSFRDRSRRLIQIFLDEVVGCAYQFERPKALPSIIITVSHIRQRYEIWPAQASSRRQSDFRCAAIRSAAV